VSRATEDAARAARYANAEAMYRQGYSLKGIGLALGMDFAHLSRILRARGVPMRPRGRPAGPTPPVAAAIADVLAGVPHTSAAAAHGVGPWAVYRRVPVSTLRAAPRRRGRCKRSQVHAALDDVRSGVSLACAARRHGVALSTLRRHVCGGVL
jgi:hypothetical protein